MSARILMTWGAALLIGALAIVVGIQLLFGPQKSQSDPHSSLLLPLTVEQLGRSLRNGADPNRRNEYAATALHDWSAVGIPEAVRLLVEFGAEVDVQDRYGMTPLHHLTFPLTFDDGSSATPQNGHATVAQILLEVGADPNLQDLRGQTPLHRATRRDQSDVIEILVQHGADLQIRDAEGRTVRDLAMDPQHRGRANWEIVAIFDRAEKQRQLSGDNQPSP